MKIDVINLFKLLIDITIFIYNLIGGYGRLVAHLPMKGRSLRRKQTFAIQIDDPSDLDICRSGMEQCQRLPHEQTANGAKQGSQNILRHTSLY